MSADAEEKKKGLTRQQWFTLIVIGSVHFGSAICVSLQAPFYPQEAESKNVSASEYGLVFGVYELTAFITSPIIGNYMDVIGAKTVLNTAVVVAGLSVIAFGLLGYVQSYGWFISLSFVIRIIEALGAAASVTSAFAITAATFPDNVATTFAALEIFYGMGYIAGPSIGGCLYSLGGYVPPFLVMGSALLLVGLVVYFVLPSHKRSDAQAKSNFKELVKVPVVFIDAFSVMSASIVLGFYSATLEPHIRGFQLNPAILGLIFIINGATYASTAPFVGMLCDKKFNPKVMILIGSVFMILSAFSVGPAPFFAVDVSLPLVIAGLILEGFGMSCIVVSAFIDALTSSVAGGFPDDISTYGLMSGLWSASFSLGDFVGPSVAGVLNDWLGFRTGSMFIVFVHMLLFFVMLIFLLTHRKKTVRLISTLPDNAIEEHINPCVILEENYIKTNGTGYGTIEKYPENRYIFLVSLPAIAAFTFQGCLAPFRYFLVYPFNQNFPKTVSTVSNLQLENSKGNRKRPIDAEEKFRSKTQKKNRYIHKVEF